MKLADFIWSRWPGCCTIFGKLVRSQPQGEQVKQPYGRATEAQGGHATDGVNFWLPWVRKACPAGPGCKT